MLVVSVDFKKYQYQFLICNILMNLECCFLSVSTNSMTLQNYLILVSTNWGVYQYSIIAIIATDDGPILLSILTCSISLCADNHNNIFMIANNILKKSI